MDKHYHGALSKSVKSANKRSGEYYPLIANIIIIVEESIIFTIIIFIIKDLIPIIAKKWILSKRSLAHFGRKISPATTPELRWGGATNLLLKLHFSCSSAADMVVDGKGGQAICPAST